MANITPSVSFSDVCVNTSIPKIINHNICLFKEEIIEHGVAFNSVIVLDWNCSPFAPARLADEKPLQVLPLFQAPVVQTTMVLQRTDCKNVALHGTALNILCPRMLLAFSGDLLKLLCLSFGE